MQTYFLRRRGIATGANQLAAVLTRLRSLEEDSPALPARWLHSYALREADGRFGLACVFQADGVRTLRRHAEFARLPAEEILPVATTLAVRRFAPTLVYLVRRRNSWKVAADLDRIAEVSDRVEDDEMARQVRCLRAYAVREDGGALGTVCLYQAVDSEVLRAHAARNGMPADEITPVIGRIVFREDAQPAAANPALV